MLLPSRSRKAFTMLELIVVIVILGILAAIAVPTFKKVIDKSEQSSVETTARALDRDANALAAFETGAVVAGQEWRAAPHAWIGAAAQELPGRVDVHQSSTTGRGNTFRVSNGSAVTYLTTAAQAGTAGTVTSVEPVGLTWSSDDLQTPEVRPAAGLNLLAHTGYEEPLSSYLGVDVYRYFAFPITAAPAAEARTGSSALKGTTDRTDYPQGFIHMAPRDVVLPTGVKAQVTAWVKGPAGTTAELTSRAHTPGGHTHLAEGHGKVFVTFTGEWQQVTTNPWSYNFDHRPGLQLVTHGRVTGVTMWMDDVTLTTLP